MSFTFTAVLFSLLPLVLAAPVSGTTYAISPAQHTSMCIAPASNQEGADLVIKDCDETDTTWLWNGSAFQNTVTNMCIDMRDGGEWSGNKAQVWGCYSWNPSQQYSIEGSMIHWKDFCLDLTYGLSAEGTAVQIWSCSGDNHNQQWSFVEVEEVDECEDECATATTLSAATSKSASAVSTASVAANGTIGEGLWVDSGSNDPGSGDWSSASQSNDWSPASQSDSWSPASQSDSWSSAPQSDEWASATTTASNAWETKANSDSWPATSTHAWGSSATPSASFKSSSGSTGKGTVSSGYLQTSGNKIVDSNGNTVVLRGTNIGGWLVLEDWMCGITDNSGSSDRFSLSTLEKRFGNDQARTLVEAWAQNWLTEADFDELASIGFNVIRLPFSFRTVQNADGSWRNDAFTRMDWAIAQAKSRGIYVIVDFHMWAGQEAVYSTISEDTDEGQSQRDAAGEIWKKVAAHYLGEPIIAAFDVINEPTGSAGDKLQQDLYKAVRSVDANRIIIHESISTDPSQYGWTNVVYSVHEYNMMGGDVESNKAQWASGVQQNIDAWNGYNIPTMLAEFMADGDTLNYMLSQANSQGLSWLSWAHSTVNMGRWGLWNHESFGVDVSSDDYNTILNAWSNMPSTSHTSVYSQFKSAASGSTNVYGKREVTPATRTTRRLHAGHGGRSRRNGRPHTFKGPVGISA
nr:hypothetical protein L204_03822 [Cryptococcus depauperatus CBS 7855]